MLCLMDSPITVAFAYWEAKTLGPRVFGPMGNDYLRVQ